MITILSIRIVLGQEIHWTHLTEKLREERQKEYDQEQGKEYRNEQERKQEGNEAEQERNRSWKELMAPLA